ncbi:hypothetical protein M9R32_13715 [Paenisporosarcina quisquiliarum]|uniref:Uncharacterized protein n=1 Tax=Paenisporosarcina quisquiliarum TaxID=365346 RepID=A0A9X3LK42_9BACL|nr:hypothetical protein [Paenisporosarcina quisquiliarum]MCZ8538249.1 hypothetical protein [Paenisporosarcina quisquiliarum]
MKTDLHRARRFGHTPVFPLATTHAKTFCKFRGVIPTSLYDSTLPTQKKAKRTPFEETDILHAINRNTGLQFKSITEVNTHVETLMQKKLMTD